MGRELRELHQGARDERRRLVPDAESCEPAGIDPVECPRCGCRVLRCAVDVTDALDRACGQCLAEELITRHGQTAVVFIEREVEP